MAPRGPPPHQGLSSPNPCPRRDTIRGPSAQLWAYVHPLGLRSIRAATAALSISAGLIVNKHERQWLPAWGQAPGQEERDSRRPRGGGTGQGQGLEGRKAGGPQTQRPSRPGPRPQGCSPHLAAAVQLTQQGNGKGVLVMLPLKGCLHSYQGLTTSLEHRDLGISEPLQE